MILLGWALACEVPAALASLKAYDAEAKASYLCLAGLDTPTPLVEAIDALQVGVGGAEQLDSAEAATLARYQRALALWLLQHAEEAWDGQVVRRLNPADRRLVADGVQARRGRETPSPEHAAVFTQFDWYRPIKGYTQNRMTDLDRQNIATANSPPPAPPPPPAPADGPAAAAPPVSAEPACGCQSSRAGFGVGGLVAAVLGAAGLWSRRKTR